MEMTQPTPAPIACHCLPSQRAMFSTGMLSPTAVKQPPTIKSPLYTARASTRVSAQPKPLKLPTPPPTSLQVSVSPFHLAMCEVGTPPELENSPPTINSSLYTFSALIEPTMLPAVLPTPLPSGCHPPGVPSQRATPLASTLPAE